MSLPAPIAEAADAVARGELVVFPTDTVYGIGTRPDDASATGRLFEAKRRPRSLELPVLVATTTDARTVARLDDRAELLALALWPGPVSLVLPRAARSASWPLGEHDDTVAVRIPANPLALALLHEAGPLAVSSANLSGEEPGSSCEELEAVFRDLVSVYLCDERPPAGRPSTVIDLTSGPARILRAGDVGPEVIARLLPGEGPLLDSGASP